MKNKTNIFITTGALVATLAVVAIPAITSAATYAYVNQNDEVSVIVASTPTTAIVTAPQISLHSGVLLLVDQSGYDIVGDTVN